MPFFRTVALDEGSLQGEPLGRLAVVYKKMDSGRWRQSLSLQIIFKRYESTHKEVDLWLSRIERGQYFEEDSAEIIDLSRDSCSCPMYHGRYRTFNKGFQLLATSSLAGTTAHHISFECMWEID